MSVSKAPNHTYIVKTKVRPKLCFTVLFSNDIKQMYDFQEDNNVKWK